TAHAHEAPVDVAQGDDQAGSCEQLVEERIGDHVSVRIDPGPPKPHGRLLKTWNNRVQPPRLARATGGHGCGYRTETIETRRKYAAPGEPGAIPADNKLAGPGNPREIRRR